MRRLTGDYPGAAEALEAALGIARDLGYRPARPPPSTPGGRAAETGDYRGAAGALEAALGICRDLGHRPGEAETLNEIGALHRMLR